MTSLRSPVFWIIAVVLAVAASLAWVQSRRAKAWGFNDLVKHPERYMPDHDSSEEAFQHALAEAQSWSAPKVAAKVQWFVLETPTARVAGPDRRLLPALGKKTHDAVIALLSDPGLRSRLTTPTGVDLLPETPFARACMLLEEQPPREAIAAVAPFLAAEDSGVRKRAAMTLGQTGQADAVPFLQKAFTDPDEYVRSYALIGLEKARESGLLSSECASALVPGLKELVATDKNTKAAAALLLHITPDQATDFFLSDKIFRAESPALHEVIGAMNEARRPIPRPMLRALIDTLGHEGAKLAYPKTYLLGTALEALGRHREPEDHQMIEALLNHAEELVAEGAAKGLISSHGLDGFEQRIWEKEETSAASLSVPQRRYLAVLLCDGEINNGGISQYFFNSSGDRWKDALAGFEAIGCTERAAILREALKPFGQSGPSEDRDTRMEQLSRLYRKNDKIFDALDSRYYESKEVIAVRSARYVLQNPEAFK